MGMFSAHRVGALVVGVACLAACGKVANDDDGGSDAKDGDSGGTTSTGGTKSSGGTNSAGGQASSGGSSGSGGDEGLGLGGNDAGPDHCLNQVAVHSPGAIVDDNGAYELTSRNGVGYAFYLGSDGEGLESRTVRYAGASFRIEHVAGTSPNTLPILKPVTFCGEQSPGAYESNSDCGLPVEIGEVSRVEFGARFGHNGSSSAGSDYSYAVELLIEPAVGERYQVVVVPRWSEFSDLGDVEAERGLLVGDDPRPWSFAMPNEPAATAMFFRPASLGGTEVAADALDFIEVLTEDYGLDAKRLLAISAVLPVYAGTIEDLRLEDFCVEVE